MNKNAECFVSKAFEEQQSFFTSTEQTKKKYLLDPLILIRFFAN